MKSDNNNKSLFWHGVFAKLKIFFGAMILFIGVFTVIADPTIGIILIIIGIALMIWGKQQRFDYKMRSGTMVHRGDW